jgi:hypothetical protein
MFYEEINGKKYKYKLHLSTGIIYTANYKQLGKQIFPNEEFLKQNFEKEHISDDRYSHLNEEEQFFYQNYWIEKAFYDKLSPVVDSIGLTEHKDSLIAILNQYEAIKRPFWAEDSDKLAIDTLNLKDFFDHLEDTEFKILNFKMSCVKDGKSYNYKISYEWLIDRLRDRLVKWKKKDHDYDYFIGNSVNRHFKGYNHGKHMRHMRRTVYIVLADYILLNKLSPSKNDVFKKTGILYAATGDLPSKEYFKRKFSDNSKYRTYHDYLADLVEKIVKRPVK